MLGQPFGSLAADDWSWTITDSLAVMIGANVWEWEAEKYKRAAWERVKVREKRESGRERERASHGELPYVFCHLCCKLGAEKKLSEWNRWTTLVRANTDGPWVRYLLLISPRNVTHKSGTDTLPLWLEFPSSVACSALTWLGTALIWEIKELQELVT